MAEIIEIEEIDSTNDWIKRNLNTLSNFDAVIAKSQYAGRGRNGKSWVSMEGGLWFSILVEDFNNSKSYISVLASVAVAEVLREYCEVDVELKWPNDVFFGSRKLGGLLIESVGKNFIIGIGINVNIEISRFPEEMREKVTTIKEITGMTLPLCKVAKEIVNYIEWGMSQLDRISARYIALNRDIGKCVRVSDSRKEYTGVVTGIQWDGGIKIKKGNEENVLYSGSLFYEEGVKESN